MADSFDGKRLSAERPWFQIRRSIWFSDNGAGNRGNYLGNKHRRNCRFPSNRPIRNEGDLGRGRRYETAERPGLLTHEKLLYVIDTPVPGQARSRSMMSPKRHQAANRRDSTAPSGRQRWHAGRHRRQICVRLVRWRGRGRVVAALPTQTIGRFMLPDARPTVFSVAGSAIRLFMRQASQSIRLCRDAGVLGG